MESPPSTSSWSQHSQPFILSDDSGLLLTTGSFSSGNTSFESRSGRKHFLFEDSDCEERSSLSQDDSLDGMSDIMCGENFNTLKKQPNWSEIKQTTSPIEPPLEFQDRPQSVSPPPVVDFFCDRLTHQILKRVMLDFRYKDRSRYHSSNNLEHQHPISPPPLPSRALHHKQPPIRPLPELPSGFTRAPPTISKSTTYLSYSSPYRSQSMSYKQSYPSPTSNFVSSASNFASSASPYVSHTPRPSSRSSLGGSSRLSSSHNSLSVSHTRRVDDSSFITQAVSHDTLSSNQISDLYNVPFDSDVYAVPVDVVKQPGVKPKRGGAYSCLSGHLLTAASKKRRRNTTSVGLKEDGRQQPRSGRKSVSRSEQSHWSYYQSENKRHSVAGTSTSAGGNEPIHMTLQEVRTYLQTLYSSSSDSSDTKDFSCRKKNNCANGTLVATNNNNNNINKKYHLTRNIGSEHHQLMNRPKKSTFLINIKNKKVKDSSCNNSRALTISPVKKEVKKRKVFSFKQALCNIFRFRRFLSVEEKTEKCETEKIQYELGSSNIENSLTSRALPPLPKKEEEMPNTIIEDDQALDFATSIQRVKDYGWYWGPLSSEAAEKILSNEPDGSFIVRDSSDDHYIFSLTFKLNNSVRHVRIEHFQGNFSFGSCTKFKSQTIVEFIENAVEHSRSGRYLFFLHRRPVIGPVRVQLLHPFSRFKQVQSLQHMCRFVIHKNVRRDLIPELPLPRRMIDYLNTPQYYSESFADLPLEIGEDPRNLPSSGENTLSFVPPSLNGNMMEENENVEQRRNLQSDNMIPVNEYIIFNA
ncbi:unnamed protein product [Ceutorhynchus assimilis]|uniref:Suppressor of cytokine signaling 7 n=1 Tax=Ceutorhynchus assimilis TaxID=467358 RepID=A0A9N9QHA5_9CUCU|nr:unnamed protein product [Ceutorhynchus assimilis]